MHNLQTEKISSISYSRTEKYIEKFEQKYSMHTYTLSLYYYKIVTEAHTFELEIISDISYKPFSTSGGLLYLHTNEGVFTYILENDPEIFINAVKERLGFA